MASIIMLVCAAGVIGGLYATIKAINKKRFKKSLIWLTIVIISGFIFQTTGTSDMAKNQQEKSEKQKTKEASAKTKDKKNETKEDAVEQVEEKSPQWKIAEAYSPHDSWDATLNEDIIQIDEQGNISIAFKAEDNLTENMIVEGAQQEVYKLMAAVKKSKVEYTSLRIAVSANMADAYGNAKNETVIDLTYNKATLDEIDFKNFNPKNIYTVADSQNYIHPKFVMKF